MEPKSKQSSNLLEIARLFLKLGVIGFGGPPVHIALMEKEVVIKRKWFTHEHFLDMVGATNLIPGPNSTEMTMHCGHERAGWKGLVVAGLCFILPAVIITGVIAYLYQRYGKLPQVESFLFGIKPAIIGVIVALMISLGKKALKSVGLGIIGIASATLVLFGANEIFVLFGAGLTGIVIHIATRNKNTMLFGFSFVFLQALTNPGSNSISWKMFWIFLKVGAVLYGSGYVLFAFLDTELVNRGLLTRQQLVDAIAIGQFTPGPIFSSATFIGWQIAGLPGAVAATIGIFLPSFLLAALLNPLIPFLRKSKIMSAFLDAVNIASVAIILAVCVDIGKASISDWKTIFIAIAGLVVCVVFKKINTAFIILGGAIAGYILSLIK
jgi:chromate transporter